MTSRRLPVLVLMGLLILAGTSEGVGQVLFRPVLGGLPADSGLAAGFELLRYRTLGPFDGRARFTGSVKKYEHIDLSLESPPPVTHDFFSEIRFRYRNYPEEDFWGLGPLSDQSRRSNYRLEDVWVNGSAGLHFRSGLRIAAVVGLIETNIGPGRDRLFPSTETAFMPSDRPALEAAPGYWHGGARLDYDRRDNRNDTRAGGLALFEWTSFMDRADGNYSFARYQIEYRHFRALSESGRLAARVRATMTDVPPSHVIPFYLQPSVGGTDTVRGLSQYRFRSANSLLFNVEYRQTWKSLLDIIVFGDAGRVADEPSDLSLKRLRGSAGFGGRIRLGSNFSFGADLGFSSEGHELWFRSGQVF